jgi:hypothetical protein
LIFKFPAAIAAAYADASISSEQGIYSDTLFFPPNAFTLLSIERFFSRLLDDIKFGYPDVDFFFSLELGKDITFYLCLELLTGRATPAFFRSFS